VGRAFLGNVEHSSPEGNAPADEGGDASRVRHIHVS
jgi:hypothetical protein